MAPGRPCNHVALKMGRNKGDTVIGGMLATGRDIANDLTLDMLQQHLLTSPWRSWTWPA